MEVMEAGWATSSHRERVVASTRTNSTPPPFWPLPGEIQWKSKKGLCQFFSLIDIYRFTKNKKILSYGFRVNWLRTDGRTDNSDSLGPVRVPPGDQ